MTEEQRAAEYRAQAVRRQAYRQAQAARLAGSTAAAARVRSEWQPIIDARAEQRAPGGSNGQEH